MQSKSDPSKSKIVFSEKSFAQQNVLKKSSKQKKYFLCKKMQFLKSLTAFYKEISERDPDFYERKLEVWG